ncbi:MAG: methyltransferase [Candidatus Aenigmatarchaeota archaeon]
MGKRKIKKGNVLLRLFFLAIAITPALYFPLFLQHFTVYMTGEVFTYVITQQWHIVVLSTLLFLAFLIPLTFRRKTNWKEYGLATAFFVSLFVEMYGIPLTILLASNYFSAGVVPTQTLIVFDFLGVTFAMDVGMTYGAILIITGMIMIITGWITLYRNIKDKELVTKGIYNYSRHPQYLGFILIVIGWFVAWPTILTLIFAPILIYKYLRVCRTEEKEIKSKEYEEYKKTAPFFI